ncbi:hypothetical protein, partial [Salmonella enterica]|uniref:hypothetical protein n=1 Tax=Salmonella enterica TaxID=28901 RepID=UPI003525A43B
LNATMSKMLPEEKIVATKDERTFARWKAMQQQWDSFQKRMAAKLGRSRDELMISAPNKYREEVEELDVIDKSIPAEKKFGTEVLFDSSLHLKASCCFYLVS